MNFQPDYTNIVLAASNVEAPRLPLYEHLINTSFMEKFTGKKFGGLYDGNFEDKKEFFRHYCDFYLQNGYDVIPYEFCIGNTMPGGGSLGRHVEPVIKNREDFEKYPWDAIPEIFYAMGSESFKAIFEVIPAGMKLIGGVGNGIFECVQEVCGFLDLCLISSDDPELYAELFVKMGDISLKIWDKFMREFSDNYCVMRFGDDLGYKVNTMLPSEDVIKHIVPQYKRIIDLIHTYNKKHLFHSCGNNFSVMDALINVAGIDAKHSNEDIIAPFIQWVFRYGDRIGNFGGVDTDSLSRMNETEIKEHVRDIIRKCKGHGGIAFSSGNSIPDYVKVENYIAMIETVREVRGDYKQ